MRPLSSLRWLLGPYLVSLAASGCANPELAPSCGPDLCETAGGVVASTGGTTPTSGGNTSRTSGTTGGSAANTGGAATGGLAATGGTVASSGGSLPLGGMSATGTVGNWWRVDLGAVHTLTRVEIMWEFARQYGYLVEVSNGDVSYTTAADLSATTDTTQTQTVPISASARYLRITATTLTASPITWMSFFEVKVYGI